jgi:phospholipid-binding lipoprotein MlaA
LPGSSPKSDEDPKLFSVRKRIDAKVVAFQNCPSILPVNIAFRFEGFPAPMSFLSNSGLSKSGSLRRTCLTAILAGSLFVGASAARADEDPKAVLQVAQANDAGSDIWDPIEPVNRYFFEVNRFLDEIMLKPAAAWYGLLPQGVRTSTGNFLGNLRTPWTVANDGLQGEGTRAGTAIARFFINTIIGFFGVFDPAKELGFVHHDEDAGQTLGAWGVQEGPYLMLPVLGASNGRDLVGFAVDTFLDPFSLLTRGTNLDWTPYARSGTTAVHYRDANSQQIDDLQRSSTDLYATVRRVSAERRRAAIRNADPGANPPSPRMTDGEGPGISGPRADAAQ